MNGWANNCNVGDFGHQRALYDITVMDTGIREMCGIQNKTWRLTSDIAPIGLWYQIYY